jgi:hypothetical protein
MITRKSQVRAQRAGRLRQSVDAMAGMVVLKTLAHHTQFELGLNRGANDMALPFATLEATKASLRMLPDETDDDALLTLLLDAASRSVANYLKSTAEPFMEEDAEAPAEVKVATIMLVGFLFKNPDQDPERYFERGYLPAPVTALLYPLRDPTVA